MHVNFALKAWIFLSFFLFFFLWGSLAGGSPWMADLVPLVPHSSHRSLKLWWISSVTFSRKKTAIISIECSSFLSRRHVQHNFSARCFNGFPDCKMTLWMPLISSSEWQKKREDFTQKRRKKKCWFSQTNSRNCCWTAFLCPFSFKF